MRHGRILREAGYGVALCPMRPERSEELAAAGWTCLPPSSTSMHSLKELARYGVTHAVVASNTSLHVQQTLSLASQGIHTLVEKPLSLSMEDGRKLLGSAEPGQPMSPGHTASLYCGLTLRFSQSLRAFRDMVPRAGRLHAVDIECRSWLPGWRPGSDYRASYSASAREGGVLRDLVHEIDYAGWIFGWPRQVFAQLSVTDRLGIAADEQAHLHYVMADGLCVRLGLDYLTRTPRRRCIAYGSDGTLTWDGIASSVTWEAPGKTSEVTTFTQTRDEMLLAQDIAFLQDKTDELVGLSEALRSIAVCDAARLSSNSQRMENVATT